MNREILFRGKRIDTGEWVYGGLNSLSHSPDDKTYIVTNEFMEGDEDNERFVFVEVNHKTIGQFTGLTDKNGTKIFEGDISDAGETVVFENGAFRTTFEGNRQGSALLSETRTRLIEIAGNVHDNPELIN